jgi:hypothetical protein
MMGEGTKSSMCFTYIQLMKHMLVLLALVEAQNIPHTFSCQHQQMRSHS